MLKTQYEDIIEVDAICSGKDIDLPKIVALAGKENAPKSVADGVRSLLIAIDNQSDFTDEHGSLTVYPGSKRDIENLTRFIYNNLEKLTDIMCSIDTHYTLQIFFTPFWEDEFGNNPAPYTMITYKDVQDGKWKPVFGQPSKALQCLKSLDENGKVGVLVWPLHCIVGTKGFNLENQFAAMVHFHSAVRRSRPQFIFKGTDIYSEQYGIIEPCYNPTNTCNWQVLNAIANIQSNGNAAANYDKVIIAGEAASHCVLESTEQILRHFAGRQDILDRIIVLEDCTTPVGGFEKQAADGLAALQAKYGIKVMKSTDVVL
jgi:nicotinamidase-related amidase